MDKPALLAELKAMANDMPDFSTYSATSRLHQAWLGRVCALVSMWNELEGFSLRSAANNLPLDLLRDVSLAQIIGTLHRSISDLELKVPELPAQAFGPGAVYDFMKNLRDLLCSATTELLVVDPYLDDQVFDAYLSLVPNQIKVRLLVYKYVPSVKVGLVKFLAQTGMNVEIRSSNLIHDRVVFIDSRTCWVLGQSIKDAAKSKPTYIAPISADAMQLKLADYEEIWVKASAI